MDADVVTRRFIEQMKAGVFVWSHICWNRIRAMCRIQSQDFVKRIVVETLSSIELSDLLLSVQQERNEVCPIQIDSSRSQSRLTSTRALNNNSGPLLPPWETWTSTPSVACTRSCGTSTRAFHCTRQNSMPFPTAFRTTSASRISRKCHLSFTTRWKCWILEP